MSNFPKKTLFLIRDASKWRYFAGFYQEAVESGSQVAVIAVPYQYKNEFGVPEGEMIEESSGLPEGLPIESAKNYVVSRECPDVAYIQDPYDSYSLATITDRAFFLSEIRPYIKNMVFVFPFQPKVMGTEDQMSRAMLKSYLNTPGFCLADVVYVFDQTVRELFLSIFSELYGQDRLGVFEEKMRVLEKLPDIVGKDSGCRKNGESAAGKNPGCRKDGESAAGKNPGCRKDGESAAGKNPGHGIKGEAVAENSSGLGTVLPGMERKDAASAEKATDSVKKRLLFYEDISCFLSKEEFFQDKYASLLEVFENNADKIQVYWIRQKETEKILSFFPEPMQKSYGEFAARLGTAEWCTPVEFPSRELVGDILSNMDAAYGAPCYLLSECVSRNIPVMVWGVDI